MEELLEIVKRQSEKRGLTVNKVRTKIMAIDRDGHKQNEETDEFISSSSVVGKTRRGIALVLPQAGIPNGAC